jgi:hypothetical protein
MTDAGDDLTALRGRVPQPGALPRQSAHRAGLMAVLSAEPPATAQPQPFRSVRPAVRRWLSPVAAAIAVGAVAVAVALPHLIGSTTAPGTGARPHSPGHGPRPMGLRWQVPLTGLRKVVVRTSAGAVTVKAALPEGHRAGGSPSAAAGPDSVVVSATRHFSGPAPVISSKVIAGVLEVRGQCPRDSHRSCTVSFTVLLPRALPVQVNDALGTVRVDDLSGPVTVTDALGEIDGVGLTSPRASLTDDLGNISVAFTAPPAHLIASGQDGNVTVSVPTTAVYRVTAQAQLGSATVSVPTSPHAVHVINASSQLGNVTVTG